MKNQMEKYHLKLEVYYLDEYFLSIYRVNIVIIDFFTDDFC